MFFSTPKTTLLTVRIHFKYLNKVYKTSELWGNYEFMENPDEVKMRQSLGWRPTFSIVAGVGWLIFLIAWLAFYAFNYVWEQNIAIILLSILVMVLLLGGVWAAWGLRMIPREGKAMMKMMGFRWRVQTSIVIPVAAMIFLIVWFWYYAIPFTVWQNIAVLLITLLVVGGILGGIWARWGIKHGDKFSTICYFKEEKHEEKEDKETSDENKE